MKEKNLNRLWTAIKKSKNKESAASWTAKTFLRNVGYIMSHVLHTKTVFIVQEANEMTQVSVWHMTIDPHSARTDKNCFPLLLDILYFRRRKTSTFRP